VKLQIQQLSQFFDLAGNMADADRAVSRTVVSQKYQVFLRQQKRNAACYAAALSL
jgi:hypothetical protein